MTVKNLTWVRQLPQIGAKLYEAFKSLQDQGTTLQQQVNGNPEGQIAAPPAIQALNVVGQNGHHSIQITDNSQIYRGIQYYVEHDTSPNFTNPQPVHLGDSRMASLFLGSGPRYWRASSAYPFGPPGPWVYFGGAAQPKAVDAGGSIGPPAALASQGSGTGAPGQGMQGPGTIPYRTQTGAPPTRS